MAKLSTQQIAAEVEAKGFKLIDATGYANMNSRIIVACSEGHLTEVSFAEFRKPSFTCPKCDESVSFVNPKAVPVKEGQYRLIAFDQATEKFGLSIFDSGKLSFYSLFTFSGDLTNRLAKIRAFVEDIVIKEGKPDFVVMEDIQYQNGILTFKVLAMLLGVLQEVLTAHKIPFEVVSPNVGRKYAGTCGKTRHEEKLLSIATVKEKYNVKVNDDVAEAILIGHYGARMHHAEVQGAFGGKK